MQVFMFLFLAGLFLLSLGFGIFGIRLALAVSRDASVELNEEEMKVWRERNRRHSPHLVAQMSRHSVERQNRIRRRIQMTRVIQLVILSVLLFLMSIHLGKMLWKKLPTDHIPQHQEQVVAIRINQWF